MVEGWGRYNFSGKSGKLRNKSEERVLGTYEYVRTVAKEVSVREIEQPDIEVRDSGNCRHQNLGRGRFQEKVGYRTVLGIITGKSSLDLASRQLLATFLTSVDSNPILSVLNQTS